MTPAERLQIIQTHAANAEVSAQEALDASIRIQATILDIMAAAFLRKAAEQLLIDAQLVDMHVKELAADHARERGRRAAIAAEPTRATADPSSSPTSRPIKPSC